MIRVRLQIGNGKIVDTYDEYRLIYVGVKEHIFAPETNGFEKTTYAEEDGENIDNRTTFKPFDYVVQFLVEAENSDIDNANKRIAAFNSKLYSEQTVDTDIKTFNQVTLYNDDDKVKIVGYPTTISKATSFWRDRRGRLHDAVQVEWTIRVDKPGKCDFEL
jgi:hypothetical protein